MNYRHAFHAGNHADVLKHVVLLALCDSLRAKPGAAFALDTHAGRGLYRLDTVAAQKTGEAEGGIGRLRDAVGMPDAVRAYMKAIDACRRREGPQTYPGSPWLMAYALRDKDRIACCELQAEEAAALKANFAGDSRVAVHTRDGYSALHALLPPRVAGERFGRGIALIDPPYEKQLEEYDDALKAIRDAATRWPQGIYALWYPVKMRRALQAVYRRFATLPGKSVLIAELLVRPDDSPLRMNGSGMMILNAPWRFDALMRETLPALATTLGEPGASSRVEWLRAPD